VTSISTQILWKGCQAKPLFGASIKIGTPISLAILVPTTEFILLMGILKTRIQKEEYWKETLPGLRSPLNCFIKINLLSKDQGLLSKTSVMSSSLVKIAKRRLLPTSLVVTPCDPYQSFWIVDLNTSLFNSLLICNLNKILNFA